MKSAATTRPVVVNPNLIQGLLFLTQAAGKYSVFDVKLLTQEAHTHTHTHTRTHTHFTGNCQRTGPIFVDIYSYLDRFFYLDTNLSPS